MISEVVLSKLAKHLAGGTIKGVLALLVRAVVKWMQEVPQILAEKGDLKGEVIGIQPFVNPEKKLLIAKVFTHDSEDGFHVYTFTKSYEGEIPDQFQYAESDPEGTVDSEGNVDLIKVLDKYEECEAK